MSLRSSYDITMHITSVLVISRTDYTITYFNYGTDYTFTYFVINISYHYLKVMGILTF